MRPATPHNPKHDAACPNCGEPFTAHRMLGIKLGDYKCARCDTTFTVIKETYLIGSRRVQAWIGEPLPTTQRHRR